MEENEEFDQIDAETKDLIRQMVKAKTSERRKISGRVKIRETLKGVIGEFLSCYKIIGYDDDGNFVNITNVHTKMEESAIENSFIEEFGRFMANRRGDYDED